MVSCLSLAQLLEVRFSDFLYDIRLCTVISAGSVAVSCNLRIYSQELDSIRAAAMGAVRVEGERKHLRWRGGGGERGGREGRPRLIMMPMRLR